MSSLGPLSDKSALPEGNHVCPGESTKLQNRSNSFGPTADIHHCSDQQCPLRLLITSAAIREKLRWLNLVWSIGYGREAVDWLSIISEPKKI